MVKEHIDTNTSKMIEIHLLSILFLLGIVLSSFGAKKLPTLSEIETQSAHFVHDTKKQIKVVMVDTTMPLYYAYAYVTINASFTDAAPLILDFENYDKVFDVIKEVRYVPENRWDNDSLFYIEGKASMVHGWGLGDLTELAYYPDSLIRVKVRPAPLPLVYEYRKERAGKIKYYIKNVYIDAKLIKVNENQCRVAFTGITSTNKPMPLWLANIIMKIALPNLLGDIEKRVKEQKKAQKREAKQKK